VIATPSENIDRNARAAGEHDGQDRKTPKDQPEAARA
jgi:hypothetical protein